MEIQQPVTSVLKHLHATQHLKSIIEVTPVSIFFCHAILQVTDPIFFLYLFTSLQKSVLLNVLFVTAAFLPR